MVPIKVVAQPDRWMEYPGVAGATAAGLIGIGQCHRDWKVVGESVLIHVPEVRRPFSLHLDLDVFPREVGPAVFIANLYIESLAAARDPGLRLYERTG